MKKLLFVLLISAMVGGGAFALDLMQLPPPLESGDILVDAGVGFVGGYSSGTMKIPPFFIQGEYVLPVPAPISVGAALSFFRFGHDNASYNETWTFASFMGRANWHWNINVDWLDLYTGISLGYLYFSFSSNYPSGYNYLKPSYGGFDFGGQLGAHFYFTEKIGAVVEVGYPYLVKAGVALKF